MPKQLITIRIITWHVRAFIEYLTVKKKIPVRSGASTKQPWECAKKEKNREKKKKEKGPYC